jgi:hypothetical protein
VSKLGTSGALTKGGKWLAGVVVVALVGALASQIVPRMFGPAELAAKLSNVTVDSDVSLEEYALRRGGGDAFASDRAAPPAVRLVAAEAATTTTATTTTEEPTTTTATTTTEEPTTTTGTTTTQDGDEPPASGRARFGQDTVVRLKPDFVAKQKLDAGVKAALDARRVPQMLVLPSACDNDVVSPACGLTSLQLSMGVADEDATASLQINQEDVSIPQVQMQLAKVFRGTRTAPAQSDPSKRDLIGATINFNVSLTGFDGESADVRWSLYSQSRRRPVPRDWLRNQRALLLRGEAEKDSGSGEFWVPIPEVRGPFFIRIGVYNAAGTRLDYADTPSFR